MGRTKKTDAYESSGKVAAQCDARDVMCGLFYCLGEGEIVGENNTYGRMSVIIIIICVTKYLHTFSIMTF